MYMHKLHRHSIPAIHTNVPHNPRNRQAARLLAGAAWAALLVLEERAHTDPDAGRVHRQIGGDTTRYYRLPAGIAGFYVVAFVGATAALLAMVARSEGEWRWDVGDVEVSGSDERLCFGSK